MGRQIRKHDQMHKYKCEICDYVYDPSIGDPEQGIEAETAFENLPDDWVCPLCRAGVDEFVKIAD